MAEEDAEIGALLQRLLHMEDNAGSGEEEEEDEEPYVYPNMEGEIEEDAAQLNEEPPVPPQGHRRLRDEPDVADADYWRDEYGEGDIDRLRLRHTALDNPASGEEDEDEEEEEDDPVLQSEEHAGGMVLPRVELSDPDLYYRELYRVLTRMGEETTRLIKTVMIEGQPLKDVERYHCNVWIKYWTSYMVEYQYAVLGHIGSTPTGAEGKQEKMSGAAALMIELLRLKLIVNFHCLDQLKDWRISTSPFLVTWLVESPGVPLDCPPKAPIEPKPKSAGGLVTEKEKAEYGAACVKYAEQLAVFNAKRRISETPVLRMKQSQSRRLLQFLTARLKVCSYLFSF